ncbi:Coenzyme F420 hydrogenase/dehydrogenase, beta subunit C-terminal domain [Phocaeicola vulgatus]|jgi:ferredoxin|nr:Coenzyme F420 hydrogenase/dehydrogenase, beta subunit C-terminal domain [Phocaeicola vulgatus]MCS3106781.1 Coenzyme F420 hydrogenase/dehydrogenase, beta subunit C-terminal domain [Phocaeicola vulgatus]MDC1563274.1 Coenzyme F420 hydrogenase/dehydrogenase, beta subunit C-terminal domain [Phocaeicola vulgatus]MDC1724709.1 Coenzyme F420 hydrogenase/dehydrogenase, beta subunit C-terminal domain [Phocaeicola vulgatus]
MYEDDEGFLYPVVDKEKCIDCGLCEIVCPCHNDSEKKRTNLPDIYAIKNKNEKIRIQSSSGGVFTLLAEEVIKKGGVVFGACFSDDWEVKHHYTESVEGLAAFRGSKYVQSCIGTTYQKVESFLKQGRSVMFTGTPCQVSGLKHYLRKEYSNLLTVDFVCHGVPSPKVWRIYLNKIVADCYGVHPKSDSSYKKYLQKVEFRSKIKGWKNFRYRMVLLKTKRNGKKKMFTYSSAFSENAYMQMFLSDLILRPSCYKCPSKAGKSGSDMTIGDFWGIEKVVPQFDDDKGISLLIINNSRFIPLLSEVQSHFECLKLPFNVIPQYNKSFLYSVKEPLERDRFFLLLYKGDDFFSFGRLVWAKNRKVSLISKINRLCVWLKKLVS